VEQTLLLVVVGLLGWGIAWVTRCHPVPPRFRNTARSGKRALLATSIACVANTALIPVLLPAFRRYGGFGEFREIGFGDIGFMALLGIPVLAVLLVTPAVFMFRDKEPLASAGVGTRNLWQAVVLGVVLSALCCGTLVWKNLAKVGLKHLLLLVPKFQTALGEEFFFRGYLQNRLMAWFGKFRGWLAASAIMVLVHLPTLFFVREFGFQDATAWCATHFAVSLLMGWLMWRTGNIVAPVLLHTFANWINVLR